MHDAHAIGLDISVLFLNVEDVEDGRHCVKCLAPPPNPCKDAVVVKGDPHPLRPTPTGSEIVSDLVIEDVRQVAEQL
jgi:hypothetical protein